jgi:RHS repeat-associated protein
MAQRKGINMNLMNYKKNFALQRIFIMGLIVLALISLTNSVQAAVVTSGLKRVSGAKVTLQQASNYLASQANNARFTKSIQFRVMKSPALLTALSKQVSPLAKPMASASRTSAPMASTPTSILDVDEVADLARALTNNTTNPSNNSNATNINNVLNIYNFVHNNIDYAPYFGVEKGPEQTLIDRKGDDSDQAELMVALLTDSGYTTTNFAANYVFGVMSIPIVNLANWFGVDPTLTNGVPTLIQNVFNAGVIPNETDPYNNQNWLVLRVWVQVTINGTNYVFDPAYKEFNYKTGINIAQATGYNQAGLLTILNTGATNGANYVQNLNVTGLRNQLTTYSNNLISTIRNQYPNAAVTDIVGGRAIQQSQLTSLPTSLPFTTYNAETYSNIQGLSMTVEIQYDGIDVVLLSSQIAGKRFLILYGASGSGVVPELFVDDGVVGDSSGKILQGSVEPYATTNTMTMKVTDWDNNSSVSTYPLINGSISGSMFYTSTYAIISDFGGGAGDAIIKKRQQALNEGLAFDGLSDASNGTVGEALNILGLTVLKEDEATGGIIDQLAGTVTLYEYEIGLSAQVTGDYITIGDNYASSLPQHEATANSVGTDWSLTGFGAVYEGGVYDQMTGPNVQGVSVAGTFEAALSQGDAIYDANSADFSSIQPLLTNYSAADISYIQGLIPVTSPGNNVYLPSNGSAVPNIEGPGYLNVNSDWSGIYALGFSSCGCGATKGSEPIDIPTVINTDQNELPAVNQTTVPTLTAAEPVDMTTGAFVHNHLDLSLGKQAPLGLAFSRHYLSSSNLINRILGNGWEHSYDIRLTQQSDVDPVLGFRSPVDSASLITAAYIAQDLVNTVYNNTLNNTTQNNLEDWVASSLIQKWASDQMYNNSINAHIGQKLLTYVQLTDGSYSPPPGVTTTLINNGNSTFSLKDRLGSIMNFNTNNQVSNIQDVDGNNMIFSYNGGNLLNTVTDQFGRSLNLTYTGSLLTSVSDSTGRSVSYGYDGNNDLTSFTDAAGKVWQYGYDGNYRMNSITNPLNIQTIANTFDASGQVTTQVAPRQGGGSATYNFYFTGVNNAVQDPLYTTTSPYAGMTFYNLDNEDRTISVENAVGATSSVTYDGQNHVVTATDPLSNLTTFTYDGTNDLTNIEDALTYNTTFGYNAAFDLTSVTDPLNHQIAFTYDASNHHHLLTATTYPNSSNNVTTAFGYYPNGYLSTITDPLTFVTTITYDNYGNPETSTTTTHPAINTSYDSIGRMLSLTDQVSSTTGFQYDPRNLLLNKTDPLNKETIFTYDIAGQLITKEDRNNNTIGYSYTPTGNIDTISYPDHSTVSFIYDLDDRLKSMTDPLGTTSYGYDDAGRLTSYTNAFGSNVSYTYDAAGNVKSLTYPDSKVVNYTYDPLNRLKTVTNWLNQTATYNYDNAGRLTSLVNFNGTITNYTYDNANRLTGLAHTKSDSTPLLNYTFTLDGNGNRTQVLQLEPLSTTISLGTTSYVYNTAKNRLTSFEGLTFSYDNEGQTATQGSTTYGFDFEHRLISAPGVTYSYDGSGNRLKAIRYGAETHYVYDASGNLLAEADNTNTITKYYIYGAGLLATVDATTGNIYCYHFNATGNTIALTDSTQAIVNSYAYTPFGIVTEQQTIDQPFKYVGQYGVYTEPSGLNYMKARYYDPSVGRFISEDPSGFAGGQVNLYAYVANNPISFIDPLGLDSSEGGNASGNPVEEFAQMMMAAPPPGEGDDSDKIINKSWTVSFTNGITYLYQKLDKFGQHLKYGITKNLSTRYTSEELDGGTLKVLASGSRDEMLKLERDLHENLPIGEEEGQSIYTQIQKSKGYKVPPY